jgi:nicotinate-nucleotide adenylyltransferase
MIGIFGGTFDPIHYGHLRSALEVQEIFGLDQVRFVLSAQPPHRQSTQASVVMRLAMLRLAIDNLTGFVVDTREMERSGPSYMVDTLESLRQEFSKQILLLFIGADAFNQLTSWHQWQRLFEYAHVVVLTRPGYKVNHMDGFLRTKNTDQILELKSMSAGKLYFQSITQLDISATSIRSMIVNGKSPQFLLPDKVLIYIREHRLYQL